MKKLLVLGSKGMAGHTIFNYLNSFTKFKVYNSARTPLNDETIIADVTNVDDVKNIIKVIKEEKIQYVINCIGLLVKACEDNKQLSYIVNQALPHYLEDELKNTNCKIIHLSTDCVFSGEKGLYSEKDIKDGNGYYAETKGEGEIINDKDLTIRMSIIGQELKGNGTGLLQWFMKQKGDIKGYTNALWSGMTTLELAKAIERIISTKPKLSGLYQLSPDYSISKFDLLKIIQITFKKHDVNIVPYDGKVCNKILMNGRKKDFKYKFPKNYECMLGDYYNYLKGDII